MIERRVVRRYASALYNAAAQADVVDRIESDLGLVEYALEMSGEFKKALFSPLIPADTKRQITAEVFGDRIHKITLAYLDLLFRKRREEVVLETEEEYIRLANEARGIVTAQVVTAVKMTDQEETRIKQKLAELTGKQVRLQKVAIPEIIGGVLVRIGDTVIDGSIRGRLDLLKEKLAG